MENGGAVYDEDNGVVNGIYKKISDDRDGVMAEPNQDPQSGNAPPGHKEQEISFKSEPQGKGRCAELLKHNLLLIFLVVSMAIGVGMGFGLRQYNFSAREIMYFEFPGKLLLRMLKMVILPLVVSSLIAGMAALPSKAAGKLGALTVAYYFLTTLLAVILGIILVVTIRPGTRGTPDYRVSRDTVVSPVDSLLDLVRNAFPNNLVTACFKQYRSKVDPIYEEEEESNITTLSFMTESVTGVTPSPRKIVDYKVSASQADGMNVLGLVVFSIVFGVIVGRMGRQGRILVQFFQALHDAIIKVVYLIIWYSPIGIMFLLAARIMKMEDPAVVFSQLGWYALTVLVGLGVHGFVVLPIIYLVLARKNPFKHILHMAQALLTALGTASSSATLPVTMRCLEENAGINRLVSRFVLPVGATVNMDGTALYEAVASIFIAQINGRDLNFGEIVTVSVTATAAAIGAAGVPEAGLVTMLIVLTAVGLPLDGVEVIYAIDWFLDRCRTSINVWGDSVGAGIVERLAGKSITKYAEDPEVVHDNLAYDDGDDVTD